MYPLAHTFQRTCTSRRTNRVTRTLHNDIFDVTDFALLRVAFNLSRRFKLTRRVTTATGPRDTRFTFHRKISPKRRDVPSLLKRPLVAWNEPRLSPLSENVGLATWLTKLSCSSLALKHRSFRKIILASFFSRRWKLFDVIYEDIVVRWTLLYFLSSFGFVSFLFHFCKRHLYYIEPVYYNILTINHGCTVTSK